LSDPLSLPFAIITCLAAAAATKKTFRGRGRERKSDNPIFWQEDYDDPYYSFPPRFFAILMFGLFPSIKKRPKRAVVEEMEWLFSLWSFFIDL
jgi:hypothetical protein